MIIILAEEIRDVDVWTLPQIAAIEKLALAAFGGSHFVLAESPSVIQHLQRAPRGTFSGVADAVFRRILARFSYQGSLLSYGFLAIAASPRVHVDRTKDRFGHVFSLEDLQEFSLQPSVLVAEHRVDAEVFHIAAEHVVAQRRLGGVCVASECRGGGGSAIADEFAGIAEGGRVFCLAITDSDERWPGCPASDVSRRCDDVAERFRPRALHYRLSVREIENLVPLSVAAELVQGSVQGAVDSLTTLVNRVPHVRVCCDVKDGTMGAKVLRLPEGSPERVFLEDVMLANMRAECGCLRRCDCFQERNDRDCACIAVPKLGAIGERFLTWLRSRSHHKALESFTGAWQSAWVDVGTMVLSACCAPPRFRA